MCHENVYETKRSAPEVTSASSADGRPSEPGADTRGGVEVVNAHVPGTLGQFLISLPELSILLLEGCCGAPS